MIKVMFVCLGNICRSPMAEFVLKDMVKKQGLEKEFYIKSSATSSEEIGNDIHYGTRDKLIQNGISFTKRKAVKLRAEDYKKYDYIIGMEKSNVINIKRIVGQAENKTKYKLDVNSSNIMAIEEILHKDNIEIDNINNLIRIELCGQGLWDYESLNFYYNDGKIKSINLYTSEKSYYIDEYLYSNTFNYDDMFKISIFISLTTIIVTICVKIKNL